MKLRVLIDNPLLRAVCVAPLVLAKTLAAPAYFTDAALTTPGLVGSYVNRSLQHVTGADDWRTTQAISGTRTDASLAFTTGTWGSRAAVGVTGGSDGNWENFSVQWDGFVRITEAGGRIATMSDDGSRFWIDLNGNSLFEADELFDNGWGKAQGVTVRDRSRQMPPGTYRIRIQYYEIGGGNEFHLVTTGWTPRQFTAGPGNPVQVVKALVLNFEPRIPSRGNRRLWEVYGWGDPRRMAAQFEADIEFMTGGAVDVQVVEMRHFDEFPKFGDGFRYNPDEYVANRDTNTGWHDGVTDFHFLMERENLASLVNRGMIDEVWCFGDHFFSLFGEAYMAGPNSFFINGPSYPNLGCDRAIAGYGFNYERGIAEMLHNLCHRTENHGQRAFGSWNLAYPVTAFDWFSANYLESPGRVAGVGTCHVPANAEGHYEYDAARVVQSTAFDWVNYPATSGATTTVSRATWGMGSAPDYHRDYMNFYFGMMPRNPGVASDGRQANWFKYIWDFNSYEAGTGRRREEGAFASGATIRSSGGASHDFTVRYYDVTGINVATIDGSDVQVTGPGGYAQLATLVGIGAQVDTTGGTARTVTYRVTAPGGTWDLGDAGTYRVQMRSAQVRDTLGNPVPAGEIGRWQVQIPDPAALNTASMLANGQATAANTAIDIGPLGNLFDGSFETLIRTPNIDPAVITLTFANSQSLNGFRVWLSYAGGNPAYRWKVETADNQGDLEARTGTFQQSVPFTGTASDVVSTVMLGRQVTARVVRLTATRLTGDDYVHINEWQLLGPTVAETDPPTAAGSSANVTASGGTAQFVSVSYADVTGIETSSLDTGDVLVTGPNGFATSATFYDVDSHTNGTPRVGTYWFIPPGGTWDSSDNGNYALALQAGEVRDVTGRFSSARVLGTVDVSIPPPVRRPPFDLAESNAEQWLAGAEGGTASTSQDATRKILGVSAIRFTTNGGADTWTRMPRAYAADWDLTAANNLYFSVYAVNTNSPQFQGNSPWVRLNDVEGGYFEYRYYQSGAQSNPLNTALNQWRAFSIPLRAGDAVTNGWRRTVVGNPRLDHIGSVEFHADTWGAGFELWFDRVGFDLPVRVTSVDMIQVPPHRLMVGFDQNVAASLSPADFVLQNLATGTTVVPGAMAIAYNAVTNVATITFPGLSGGRLTDGAHQLTVAAAAVTDPAGNTLGAAYSARFLVANDTDGDWMSDAWESMHGFNAGDPGDTTHDPDGDGAANAAEYLAGTHPRDPGSRFMITSVTRAGGGIQLIWRSVAGRRYHVQWTEDSATWVTMAAGGVPLVIDANGPSTSFTVPLDDSSPRRMYRVKVLPP